MVPAASVPTPSTVLKPVLEPSIVSTGVTLPQAPGGNTTTDPASPEESLKLPTTRVPSASTDKSSLRSRPVLEPLIVQIGLASPDAPGAYSVMLSPEKFET